MMNSVRPRSAKPLATLLTTAAVATLLHGCAVAQAPTAAQAPAAAVAPVATVAVAPKTLTVIDRKVGDGALAETGQPVAVHYTGYLWDRAAPGNKGSKFDSSADRKVPFGFIIGAGRVIKGWDEGVAGMKVGGQRTLIIPPDKGYGERGAGAAIPPNATLVFDVELMSVIGKTQNASSEPSAFVPAAK